MDGIVSILPPEFYRRVEALWQELESECELTGIRVTPIPHFSWQVAERYDNAHLADALRQFARREEPLQVRTAGLGIFSGPAPVIYLALAKDETLLRFHQRLWNAALPAAVQPNLYYAPDLWVPHITLAYGDVTPEKAACALSRLLHQVFDWKIPIDNIALIGQAEAQASQEVLNIKLGG